MQTTSQNLAGKGLQLFVYFGNHGNSFLLSLQEDLVDINKNYNDYVDNYIDKLYFAGGL